MDEQEKKVPLKVALPILMVLLCLISLCGLFFTADSFIRSVRQNLDLTSNDNVSIESPVHTNDVIRYDNAVIKHLNTLTDLQNETNDLIINSNADLSEHSRTILRIGTDMGVSILEYRRLDVPPERTDLDRIINNYNAKITAAHDALLDYSYSGSSEQYEVLEQTRVERSKYWESTVQPAVKKIETEYD